MGKASAQAFSLAGDQFLGKSYKQMDCQKFVENCMRQVGITLDLPGSNAWYRKMTWTGTPEECKRIFGSVPKGALLYILEQDGKEPDKYKPDGIGNASHIGIKTGRGKGAIHSSASKGGVIESYFADETIRNGGWNRVGLWDAFTYGDKIDRLLSGEGTEVTDEPEEPESETNMAQTAIIRSGNGKDVNLRAAKDTNSRLIDSFPVGTEAEILSYGENWCKVKVKGKTGYMMTQFLDTGDDPENSTEPGEEEYDLSIGEGTVVLRISAEAAQQLLPILDDVVDQLVSQIGRG